MNICPLCGDKVAYLGFTSIECIGQGCENNPNKNNSEKKPSWAEIFSGLAGGLPASFKWVVAAPRPSPQSSPLRKHRIPMPSFYPHWPSSKKNP